MGPLSWWALELTEGWVLKLSRLAKCRLVLSKSVPARQAQNCYSSSYLVLQRPSV